MLLQLKLFQSNFVHLINVYGPSRCKSHSITAVILEERLNIYVSSAANKGFSVGQQQGRALSLSHVENQLGSKRGLESWGIKVKR